MNLRKEIRSVIREQYHSFTKKLPSKEKIDSLRDRVVDVITNDFFFNEEEMVVLKEKVEDFIKEVLTK